MSTLQKLIYVVDDHPSNLVLLNQLLSPNYNVQCFEYAEELLLAVMESKPDLVLLDLMLPGASGYDVIASIKAVHGDADIPIIIVSGKTDDSDIQAGLNMGAVAYICKPIDLNEVTAKVNQAIGVADASQV